MLTDNPSHRNAAGPGASLAGKMMKTMRHYRKQILLGLRGRWWDVQQPRLNRPVFIIGCSRAGTTVVYKTFSTHPDLGTLNRETHDFWVDLHPLRGRDYSSHALGAADATVHDQRIVSRYFYSQSGRLRVVDKNNQNGLCVPYLHALFPSAHFVYVKRNPGDNIHSLIEGWGKADEFATWSRELPAEVMVDHGRYRRWCFFLAEGWLDYVNAPIEEVCAHQYRSINSAILDARAAIPSSQWTEIFYEDLVQDPVVGFEKAFSSAGLVFTAQLRDYCARVLERPFNAFSEIRLDKWKFLHNRDRIEQILPKVEEVARRMGYEANR